MVKVIERPVPVYHIDCKKCGAYLEYINTDVNSGWNYKGNWEESIVCPNCKKKVVIVDEYVR